MDQIVPLNRKPVEPKETKSPAQARVVPRARPTGLNMNRTANRLILLLQIYRDGAQQEARVGTYETDLRMLTAAGLVNHVAGRIPEYMTTIEGDAYVKRLLAIEP